MGKTKVLPSSAFQTLCGHEKMAEQSVTLGHTSDQLKTPAYKNPEVFQLQSSMIWLYHSPDKKFPVDFYCSGFCEDKKFDMSPAVSSQLRVYMEHKNSIKK